MRAVGKADGMGATFRTWALRGAHGAEATERVVEWLERRGFELEDEEILFDRPSEEERGVVIASDGAWTIAAFDRREEEDRFVHELRALGASLLETWVYDSDEWGYRLEEGGREIESFDTLEKQQSSALEICRVAGCPERVAEIRKVFASKRVFAERALNRFVTQLGVPGAAYDYWDWIAIAGSDEPALREYTVARLRFRRPGPRARIDLHSATHPRRLPPSDPVEAHPALPPEVSFQFALVRTLFLILSVPFRLLFFLLQPVLHIVFRIKFRGLREQVVAKARSRFVESAGSVTIPRHRLHFEIPSGTRVEPVVVGRDLLALELEGVRFELHALRPEQVRDRLAVAADARILDDVRYEAGDRPARGLLVQAWERTGRAKRKEYWTAIEMVEVGVVVYELRARSQSAIPEGVRRQARSIAASMRRPVPKDVDAS